MENINITLQVPVEVLTTVSTLVENLMILSKVKLEAVKEVETSSDESDAPALITNTGRKTSFSTSNSYKGNVNDNCGSAQEPHEEPQEEETEQTGTVYPSLKEIQRYVNEKGYSVDPKRFYDYYAMRNWKDYYGFDVSVSWRQRLDSWQAREPMRREPMRRDALSKDYSMMKEWADDKR